MKRKTIKGASGTFLMKIAGIGLTFLATIALTRSLGAEQYGVYVFVLTLVGLLTEPQFVGLRTVAVKNSSVYVDKLQYGALKGLSKYLRKISFLGGSAVFFILLVSAVLFGDDFGGGSFWVFIVAAAYPFLIGYNRISDGVLRGAGAIISGQFPKLVLRPALLCLYVVIAAYILGDMFNATWGIGMLVAAAATSSIVYYFLISRRLGANLSGVNPEYDTEAWRKGMIPLMLSGICTIIDNRAGVLMLGFFGDPADAGMFHAAFRLAELIMLAQAVINIMIEPSIARYVSSGEIDVLQKKITKAARFVLVVTIPATLVVFFGGEYLLLLFGEEFAAAAPALLVLAIAQLIKTTLGVVVPILNLSGHPKESVKGMTLGLIVHIGLGALLIPSMGLIGAAWASMMSIIVYKLYLMVRVYKILGIYTTALGSWINPYTWFPGR